MSIIGEDATILRGRLGPPRLGVVLGSGFSGMLKALGARDRVSCLDLPGFPAAGAHPRDIGVFAADLDGARLWVFDGRLHTYDRFGALAAAYPVALLAAAGAPTVALTCAAGGLREDDRPGDFAVVTDHVNLLGDDPIRHIPPDRRNPRFLDLQRAYDPELAAAWRTAAHRTGARLRDGVLAAMTGPCYETPAEVRMLRALGADLASMSVVPEAILAAYHRMRVAAIACISNRGAGSEPNDEIAHDRVQDVVGRAVGASATFLRSGLGAMLF